MNVEPHSRPTGTWSTPFSPGRDFPARVVPALETVAHEPQAKPEGFKHELMLRLTSRLAERVYRPTLAIDDEEERWVAMVQSLETMNSLTSAANQILYGDPKGGGEQLQTDRLISVLTFVHGPEVGEAASRGFRYLAKRMRLLARNGHRLERLYAAHEAAGWSNNAASGFTWALIAFLLGNGDGPLEEEFRDPEKCRFVLEVLRSAGECQYAFLRQAENALRDAIDDPPVEAGPLDDTSRAMEEDANEAWLEVQRALASSE